MKKYTLFFLLLIIAGLRLNAQEYKTDESISKQLKNNSQPGMRYAPASSGVKAQPKPHATMVEEIRQGKHGRVQGGGSGAAPGTMRQFNAGNQATLPSSKSSGEAAQTAKAAAKTAAAQAPPTQDGGNTPAETKAVPVKELKALPVKKTQQ